MTDKSMTVAKSLRKRFCIPVSFLVLIGLIFLDIGFISLHIGRAYWLNANYNIGFLASDMWLVEQDRGFPELFQYAKTLTAAVLLWRLFNKHHKIVYVGWALAFSYVVLDDTLQLHEGFGNLLLTSSTLPSIFGINSFLYVEALLWGVVALLLFSLICYAYDRDPGSRTLSHTLFGLFVFLFLFAGVADAVHAHVDHSGLSFPHARGIATTVEDGGEMIALSFLTAYVFSYFVKTRAQWGHPPG